VSCAPSERKEPLLGERATRDCTSRHDPLRQRGVVVGGIGNDQVEESAWGIERYQYIGALEGRSIGEFECAQIRLDDSDGIA
jgi:hypothetical protein